MQNLAPSAAADDPTARRAVSACFWLSHTLHGLWIATSHLVTAMLVIRLMGWID